MSKHSTAKEPRNILDAVAQVASKPKPASKPVLFLLPQAPPSRGTFRLRSEEAPGARLAKVFACLRRCNCILRHIEMCRFAWFIVENWTGEDDETAYEHPNSATSDVGSISLYK